MSKKSERTQHYQIVIKYRYRTWKKSGRTFYGFDKRTMRPLFFYPREARAYFNRFSSWPLVDAPTYIGRQNAERVLIIVEDAVRAFGRMPRALLNSRLTEIVLKAV